jgi:hypothetical protein
MAAAPVPLASDGVGRVQLDGLITRAEFGAGFANSSTIRRHARLQITIPTLVLMVGIARNCCFCSKVDLQCELNDSHGTVQTPNFTDPHTARSTIGNDGVVRGITQASRLPEIRMVDTVEKLSPEL